MGSAVENAGGGLSAISKRPLDDYRNRNLVRATPLGTPAPAPSPAGLRARRDYHPKGLEPKGSRTQRVSSYRYGFRVRIARNGLTAPVVNVSGPHFLFDPKRRRAGLWTVDCSFKKSDSHLPKTMGDAMCPCPQPPRWTICLACIVLSSVSSSCALHL